MTQRPNELAPSDADAIYQIVRQLADAWNAADGAAYAEPFAADADFVNVYGLHARGRDVIARGHDAILKGVYRDSRLSLQVTSLRLLTPDVALCHLRALLEVPHGPMAGNHAALPSMVVVRGGGWEIASFHNTWIQNGGIHATR